MKKVIITNLSKDYTIFTSNNNINNHFLEISFKNKQITFLGVTFKPNTDDMREACSLYMIPYLVRKGVKVKYFDPSGKKNVFNNKNI